MGTILTRKRKNGTVAYHAQVLIKRDGKIAYRETRTFDRKAAASAWIDRTEEELANPSALKRVNQADPPLRDVIDRYIEESKKAMGRTKTQVLRTLKEDFDIVAKVCSEISSTDIVTLAGQLGKTRQPQTVANYMSHLGAVFAIAKAAWGYPLDPNVMKDAHIVAKKLGITGKGQERERRPTLAELDKLLAHYQAREAATEMLPMTKVIIYAIFSTRRQDEIVSMKWKDLDQENNRALVRDMKNPNEKKGNNVWVDIPPEAMHVINAMPRIEDRIFPYTTDAISASFTRACQFLRIEDLHFHDLRHDGISRLFELGNNIPHVAAVSGHRSWSSLKRYTHIRQSGDKYKDWAWLQVAGQPLNSNRARSYYTSVTLKRGRPATAERAAPQSKTVKGVVVRTTRSTASKRQSEK